MLKSTKQHCELHDTSTVRNEVCIALVIKHAPKILVESL